MKRTVVPERESAIKSGILAALRMCPRLKLWNAPCGVGRSMDGRRVIRFGTPGMADLTGVLSPDGQRVEIEVKTASGKLEPSQVAFQQMIEESGGIYLVFRSVTEAVETTKAMGWWS